MRVFNQTEKIAFQMRKPPVVKRDDWRLFYGDSKTAMYGPAPYSHCVTYKKQLIWSGYKEIHFKIR